jgi:hypothetical protein
VFVLVYERVDFELGRKSREALFNIVLFPLAREGKVFLDFLILLSA